MRACSRRVRRSRVGERDAGALAHGFGLGFVQGGDVLLQKRPRTVAAEVDLYSLTKDMRADACRRPRRARPRREHEAEDADPFRFRSWLFGSIGEVPEAASRRSASGCSRAHPPFCGATSAATRPASTSSICSSRSSTTRGSSISRRRRPRPCCVALQSSLTFVDRLLTGDGGAPLSSPSRRPTAAASWPPASATRCATWTSRGSPTAPYARRATSAATASAGAVGSATSAPRASSSRPTRDVAALPGWRDVPDRSALIAGPIAARDPGAGSPRSRRAQLPKR